MQIRIDIDPLFDSAAELLATSVFLAKLAEVPKISRFNDILPPQPEVGQNTGSAASGLSLSTEGSAVTGAGAEAASTADEAPAAGTSGRPRGRPRKVIEPAPEAAAPQTTQAPAEPEAKTEAPSPSGVITPATNLNLDDHVRPALGAYTAKNGIEKGVALLAEFNAKRVSELQPEQYADFVKKCEV